MTRRFVADLPGFATGAAPISQAVAVGDLCWISGQVSVDAEGRYLPGTAAEEAERAFARVVLAAEAAGFAAEHIAYVDLAFADLADLAAVNADCARLFSEGARPARTVYQAAALPLGAKIKVQAVAAR